jgi:glycyl-tRNA synthetase
MVYRHDNIEGVDAAILMHPTVWKASGHVDAFNDPMIDDKASKMRYRADQLIEGHIDRLRKKGKDDQAGAVYERLVAACTPRTSPRRCTRSSWRRRSRAPTPARSTGPRCGSST